MSRPWATWCTFGLCALVALLGLGWITFTALRLERDQLLAGQRTEIEERVRLALWRMDSALAPLVLEESARPPAAYAPSSPPQPPPQAPKNAPGSQAAPQPARAPMPEPSPLLSFTSSNVLLHFEYAPGGRLSSPQVPAAQEQTWVAAGYVTREQLRAASGRLEELDRLLKAPPPPEATSSLVPGFLASKSGQGTATYYDNGSIMLRNSASLETVRPALVAQQTPAQALGLNNDIRQVEQQQQLRNTVEYAQRANISQQARQQFSEYNTKMAPPSAQLTQGLQEKAGLLKPMWLADQLFLARRIERSGSFMVQGVWLNWTNLRATLLASVKDLFPTATLTPARASNHNGESRLLASLPVRLEPGSVPATALPLVTPVRLTLLAAWAGVLLAAMAVAFLLFAAVSLSERRAAFVSAVTHELRTPLTTFKMYSEMLADDMVPDPSRRRQYLETLSVEANRLSHLVENVLAYARLERGSARRREERITLSQLIQRVKPRLAQRADQAGMSVAEDADLQTSQTLVHVDVSAVEQILFNLVDNACKYAAPTATEKVIHLEALPEGKFAMLRVRDHGQGISAEGAKRLFQPFSKSAQEAAQSAPGVGLGLALCRRLSRSMGGDLRLARGQVQGACFELLLPLTQSPA